MKDRERKIRAWDGKNLWECWKWKNTDELTHNGKPSMMFNGKFHERWMYGLDSDNIILMDYIGHKDVDKNDIYEYDVVEFESGLEDYHYVVEFVLGGYQLVSYKKKESSVRGISNGMNQGYIERSDDLKVIGNIFQNEEFKYLQEEI